MDGSVGEHSTGPFALGRRDMGKLSARLGGAVVHDVHEPSLAKRIEEE